MFATLAKSNLLNYWCASQWLHTCEKGTRERWGSRTLKLGWGDGVTVFLCPVLKKCSAVDETRATFSARKTIGRKKLFIARSDFTGTNVGFETTWDNVAAKESFFQISQLHRAVMIVEGLFYKSKKLKYFILLGRTFMCFLVIKASALRRHIASQNWVTKSLNVMKDTNILPFCSFVLNSFPTPTPTM